MADILPGIPSVPGDETTWSNFVDQFETLKKGDIPLSLTNWDTGSAKPAVEAGSALEIAGATYRFTSEQEIDDEAGVASGTVYVVVKTNDPNANSATPYFSSVAPIWRADLNGWYDAGGSNRYTGHFMLWDGGSSYTDKANMYGLPAPNLKLGGTLDVTGETSLGSLIATKEREYYEVVVSTGGDFHTLSKGFHVVVNIIGGPPGTSILRSNGAMSSGSELSLGALYYSDGISIRIVSVSAESTIEFYKIFI